MHLAADRADSLALLAWELSLNRIAEPPADLSLRSWATAIAKRVGGLTETLSVYEVDESRGEAILRSASPAQKGDALAYFEVRLMGLKSATIRRFSAERTASARTQVAFPITHEALAKLAGDIAG